VKINDSRPFISLLFANRLTLALLSSRHPSNMRDQASSRKLKQESANGVPNRRAPVPFISLLIIMAVEFRSRCLYAVIDAES
jgi:hypothetical protein